MALTPIQPEDLRRVVNIATNRTLAGATGHSPDKFSLLAVMHETNFTAPFDWEAWLAELPQDALNDPAYLDTADLETLRRLVTAHVRIDRFVGGHLDAVLANGYMDRAMGRAKQLLNEQLETPA